MNLKLSEAQITALCRELMSQTPELTGRALRAELSRRYGSVGKKDRVYALWRSLRLSPTAAAVIPTGTGDLTQQLADARQQIDRLEASLADMERRALRSETREQLHQDRWAREIHVLREALKRQRRGGDGSQM